MPPTEYFPDNLEENVNVKMVLIVEKARFAIAIDLSILHSSVLKMRLKVRKICLRHFHKGPVKLINRVKIAHSLLQFVSNQFHVIILSLPM